MPRLVVRRDGNMIDISPDGVQPLPAAVVSLLRPHLTYQHRTLLRGMAKVEAGVGLQVEDRRVYELEAGRLVTTLGMSGKIFPVLQAAGYTLQCMDLTPAPTRPAALVPDVANLARSMNLRPAQWHAIAAMSGAHGGIIDAPTAFGKTYAVRAMCHLYPQAKIDVVVRPKDVAAKIVERLSAVFPAIGMMGAGKNVLGERITVYTAGSLHRSDGDADILLADEAHNLVTDKTAQALAVYRRSRNFGFTATPEGRLDGADMLLTTFFGPRLFRMSYREAQDAGLVVPIRVRWLPIRSETNPAANLTDVPLKRWGLWRNEFRNRAIAADIYAMYPPDTQILVLCETIDHLAHLLPLLPDFVVCHAPITAEQHAEYVAAGLFRPDLPRMTPELRKQYTKDFERGTLRRVIATDVWSTGVDFPALEVLYRVDARESAIQDTQAPGRVARLSDGKAYGEVVDCLDLFDPVLLRKSRKRKSHYDALGWEQAWPLSDRLSST